jgi:hypothetical protein
VTEFARRRTRTTIEYAPWPSVVDAVVERWPWLDDDEPPEASETVYAGEASFYFAGDGPGSRIGAGDPDSPRRCHTDPTWILDVLVHAGREERLADDHLRFRTDLADTGAAIVIPPHRGRRPPLIAGEVWLDGEGRIRRATWRSVARREQGGSVQWSTTELWDFGIPVEIARPDAPRDPPLPVGLVSLAWTLWRRKRAYERRRDPTG